MNSHSLTSVLTTELELIETHSEIQFGFISLILNRTECLKTPAEVTEIHVLL